MKKTGHLYVVVQNGFNVDGTPTSIAFAGRLFDEGRLISFAKKARMRVIAIGNIRNYKPCEKIIPVEIGIKKFNRVFDNT